MTEFKKEQLIFTDARKLPVKIAAVIAIIFAIVFAWFAVRWQLGNMFAEYTSLTEPNVEQTAEYAVAFAPSDPMANWFAAASNRDVFIPGKRDAALEKYENVIRLAPFDYRWWIELGRAREQGENVQGAEQAFQKAVEIAPNYAFPRWQLGNFYLRQGERDKAFAELKKAADSSNVYRLQVFSTVWEYFDNNPKILEEIAGNSPVVLADLSQFYAMKERAADSLRIWEKLPPEQQEASRATGKMLAQALFDKKFFRSAIGFANRTGIDAEAKPESFQNGGFENLINREDTSFFNWKIIAAEKVEVRSDVTQKIEGTRSLRISFSGFSDLQYSGVYQVVVVEPSAKYRLNFSYRTDNLKSAGNPLIEVVNANDTALIARTKAFESGTTEEWRKGELTFTAPPATEAVMIRVAREICGEKCPLVGTLWIDNFSITRQ